VRKHRLVTITDIDQITQGRTTAALLK